MDGRNQIKALIAALFWGASFVATKATLQEIHPVTLIVLRFGLGVVVLGVAVFSTRMARWVGWRDLALLAVLGAISIAVHQALQATGLLFTSASSMAWLVALNPAFTAILAWFFIAEQFSAGQVLGLLVAFSGAVVVVTKGVFTSETLHLPSTMGDLLALASALNWAIFSVASKPLLKRLPPTLMMAYVMLLGWLLTLPFFIADQSWNEIGTLSLAGWGALLFLGIFCSGIAYIFWYDALAHIDASKVAAFIYIEPLVTVVVAAIVLSEPFTIATFVGGLAILGGVYLVNRPTRRRSPDQATEAVIVRD